MSIFYLERYRSCRRCDLHRRQRDNFLIKAKAPYVDLTVSRSAAGSAVFLMRVFNVLRTVHPCPGQTISFYNEISAPVQ